MGSLLGGMPGAAEGGNEQFPGLPTPDQMMKMMQEMGDDKAEMPEMTHEEAREMFLDAMNSLNQAADKEEKKDDTEKEKERTPNDGLGDLGGMFKECERIAKETEEKG